VAASFACDHETCPTFSKESIMRSTFIVGSGLVLLAAAVGSTPVVAQDVGLASASATVCSVKGTVTLTIAGITQVLPISCQGQATVSAAGTNQTVTGNLTVGVPGVANIVSLSNLTAIAQETLGANATTLSGSIQTGSTSLLNNTVVVSGAKATLTCTATTMATTLQCQPAVSGASVSVNGQAISVPNPIPLNYTIPLPSVSVVVQTPLGAISVPTSGTLTLNGVVADGTNTSNLNVAQLGEHLQVGGGVNVLGLGLVNVSVDATNSSSFNLQTAASVPVFSKVTF
jgi:hypothetical protein